MKWASVGYRNHYAARVEQLLAEIARLRDENARLRIDRQRPLDLASVGDRARSLATDGPSADEGDEIMDLFVRAETVRTSVRAVLHDLRVAAAQLERRVAMDAPATEIDRRVLERRSTDMDVGDAESPRVLLFHPHDDETGWATSARPQAREGSA